jgi:hypothetical protein
MVGLRGATPRTMEGYVMTDQANHPSSKATTIMAKAPESNDKSKKPGLANESTPHQSGDEEPLDVAIDVSAIKANSGGVRRYAHELVAHLRAQHIRPLLLARSNDLIDAWPGADRFIASAPANRVRRLFTPQDAPRCSSRHSYSPLTALHDAPNNAPNDAPNPSP